MTAGTNRRPAGFPGCFVTFEGVEGSGKSTQIGLLARRLTARGVTPVVTKEPGGTDLGNQLRSLLLTASSSRITPMAELLLYAADRAQHLEEVIEPALRDGSLVLCDRYLDATLAYQGYGRGLEVQMVLDLHRHPPLDLRPDRTLVLDIDPQLALERARHRNRQLGPSASQDRFEQEAIDFHCRVRQGYLALAAEQPERFRVIPAEADIDEVHSRVVEALRDLVPVSPEDS